MVSGENVHKVTDSFVVVVFVIGSTVNLKKGQVDSSFSSDGMYTGEVLSERYW